jgi:SAM-dependent methyltransferase
MTGRNDRTHSEAAAKEAPPDAFGRTAREYELGRPLWPEDLLDLVIADLRLAPEAAVLDLGAGTGKLTRALLPRFDRVFAVEPDQAMLDVLEAVVPGAEGRQGSAEDIPLADDSVEAVFSGEAFHWFATPEALAEIVRVLRPCGALVVFWNIGLEYPDLGEEVDALIDEAIERGGVPGLPKVLSGEWRGPIAAAGFEGLREGEVERDLVTDREGWIANLLSVSSIAAQPDEDRAALVARLQELVPPGELRRSVKTVAYWTRLV